MTYGLKGAILGVFAVIAKFSDVSGFRTNFLYDHEALWPAYRDACRCLSILFLVSYVIRVTFRKYSIYSTRTERGTVKHPQSDYKFLNRKSL